jgi:hypothetical protein
VPEVHNFRSYFEVGVVVHDSQTVACREHSDEEVRDTHCPVAAGSSQRTLGF